MLITLGLILLILIMVVGGDRGVCSLIALCGNLLIFKVLQSGLWHQEFLFFSLRFVSALSFPVLRCSIKMVEMERHGVHFWQL